MNTGIDLDAVLAAARSAVGCLSAVPLFAHPVPGPNHDLYAIASEHPASLRADGGLRGGSFNARLFVRFAAPSNQRVVIVGYAFVLRDRHGRELLAFHWHPESAAATPRFPHLHVSARLRIPTPAGDPDGIPLDKLHLPTGFVPLPAVVRMLIVEFGIRPLAPTWQARLTAAAALLDERPDTG